MDCHGSINTVAGAAATFQDKATPNRRFGLRPLYAFFLVSCFPLLLLPISTRWIPCTIVQHTLHSLALRESLLQYVYLLIDLVRMTNLVLLHLFTRHTRWHSAVRVFNGKVQHILNAFLDSFGSCIRYFQGRYWYCWYRSFQT